MQPTSIKKSQHLSTIYKTFKNIRSPPNNEIPPSIYPIEPDPHEAKMYRIINNMNRHHELAGEAGYPFFPLEIANVYDEHLRTVQLSIITEKNYKSVNEYIYHTADFDFTAISWSFKHKRLWTRNFDSIILKKCSFNISDIRWVNAFGCGTETLIAMEMEENDDIDEEELKDTYSLHNMQTMLTRCKIRKIKYEHRGYSIKIEDQEAIEKFYEENE
ncbi:MAG: hypothetical protein Hyperionvirus11_5 [Hyperionvirus sp.]|uniref:Uncharacterized protein n=1 Tax=Hyperionvirus sp. TaxID=2487770 RepID=A0A3G5A9G8_9VIRU|nr:MAG: hypothetical protein Hyperionvirus11_5 [Hyperionvirus sp.]